MQLQQQNRLNRIIKNRINNNVLKSYKHLSHFGIDYFNLKKKYICQMDFLKANGMVKAFCITTMPTMQISTKVIFPKANLMVKALGI